MAQETVRLTLATQLATCLSHSGEREGRPLPDTWAVPVPVAILRAALAAAAEHDRLLERFAAIQPRTLGGNGPPTEWPVVVFIDGLEHPFWAERRDGFGWWVSRADVPHPAKHTDRYIPLSALLPPQPETPP